MAATARIIVTDPQKIGDSAINSYISYKVATELSTKVQGLDSQTYNVVRRFSDFVWLRTQIRDQFPFFIVPSLPEKQQLGRFNQEFVDVRMRALQRFVERIGSNPEIVNSMVFKNFISMPAEPFAALRDSSKGDLVKGVADAGKKTLLRAVRTMTAVVKDALAGRAPGSAAGGGPGSPASTAGGKNPEDLAFRDMELYLFGQAPLLTSLYNSAAAYAVRAREQAQLLLDFGAALRALGQTEAEGGPAAECFNQVGLAAWASSTAAYEAAVCETEAFVEKLADYVRECRAVRETMEARSRASVDRAEALGEVERITALISSLNANPTAQAMKDRMTAESDLINAKRIAGEARGEYDAAAQQVVQQVDKMRGAMVGDFRAMLLDFVTIQVRTEVKLAAAWEKVASETGTAAASYGGMGMGMVVPVA